MLLSCKKIELYFLVWFVWHAYAVLNMGKVLSINKAQQREEFFRSFVVVCFSMPPTVFMEQEGLSL